MQFDGLWDPYGEVPMGSCGEVCAKEYGFTREAQDEYAVESYTRARKAIESGYFAEEVLPIEVNLGKKSIKLEVDEEPFSVDLEKLSTLRPAFDKQGTITAANASSINDGAAMLVMCDLKTAKAKGLKPLAKIVGQASFAQDPTWFTTAPIGCIKAVLEKTNLTKNDIDLFEINEAFAVVAMAAIKDLKLNAAKVNLHGGAVALGHPIGCSGARILVTLLHALKRTNGKRGLATLCIGGGEASAVIVELM
jgi:acetyl-CoA C-acetyltransferase